MCASNGSGQTRLTNDPKDDRDPSWSPDNTKIAFSSNRAGGTGDLEIYVMGAANGNSQARLTTRNGADTEPFYLSSSKIAFVSATGLFTIAPTGGTVTGPIAGTGSGDINPG